MALSSLVEKYLASPSQLCASVTLLPIGLLKMSIVITICNFVTVTESRHEMTKVTTGAIFCCLTKKCLRFWH